ncbi:MAG: NAD(P)-binding domain-containing protein [Pseudomonadota bacterium]
MRRDPRILDCIIIGAGQAGLSAGRLAQGAGLDFLIVEKGEAAGQAWTERAPDHLLFTPRAISKLPGLLMSEGPQTGYPTNAEMARYFDSYARIFDLPLRTNCPVVRLSRVSGIFEIALEDGTMLSARTVVLANGSNQSPHVPAALAEPIAHCTTQTNARDFWQSKPKPGARVLVVGDGASGRQTALDHAAQGFDTQLAGIGRRLAPARIMGKSIFEWLLALRLLQADKDTARARLLRHLNPVPSKKALGNNALRDAGVELRPKLVSTMPALDTTGTTCGQATFSDGTVKFCDHIVWCVGYQEESPFNEAAIDKPEDWYTKGRGLTDLPGLFVTGRVWLTSRMSELILGAPVDAERAMNGVIRHLAQRASAKVGSSAPQTFKEQHHA